MRGEAQSMPDIAKESISQSQKPDSNFVSELSGVGLTSTYKQNKKNGVVSTGWYRHNRCRWKRLDRPFSTEHFTIRSSNQCILRSSYTSIHGQWCCKVVKCPVGYWFRGARAFMPTSFDVPDWSSLPLTIFLRLFSQLFNRGKKLLFHSLFRRLVNPINGL